MPVCLPKCFHGGHQGHELCWSKFYAVTKAFKYKLEYENMQSRFTFRLEVNGNKLGLRWVSVTNNNQQSHTWIHTYAVWIHIWHLMGVRHTVSERAQCTGTEEKIWQNIKHKQILKIVINWTTYCKHSAHTASSSDMDLRTLKVIVTREIWSCFIYF